jgi:hypothetical protein
MFYHITTAIYCPGDVCVIDVESTYSLTDESQQYEGKKILDSIYGTSLGNLTSAFCGVCNAGAERGSIIHQHYGYLQTDRNRITISLTKISNQKMQ